MAEGARDVDPTRWVAEHGDALYAYARLRLGSDADAEDAVQETLVAALDALTEFRGDAAQRTWLIGILRHKVLDTIRRRARDERFRAALTRSIDADEPTFARGSFVDRLPLDTDPDGPAEAAEQRRRIREALEGLPEPMRIAVCLRELDGLDSETIGSILDVSRPNVWTLVHRAKTRLRAALAEPQLPTAADQTGRPRHNCG